jgi:hypothetical protein
LHNAGLLIYRDGEITILDRAGIEKCTCECYSVVKIKLIDCCLRQLTDPDLSSDDCQPVDTYSIQVTQKAGMFLTLGAATFVIIIVTVLPVWRHPHWIIRSLDFPRLQFMVMATILLIAQAMLLDIQSASTWVLVLPTGLCIA